MNRGLVSAKAEGRRRQKADPCGGGSDTTRHLPPAMASVRVTQHVDASPDGVFSAWLDPGTAGRWLFATASRPVARVSIDPRAGGSFCFVERRSGAEIEHAGEYLEIARPRRLVFTLSEGANGRTRVRVEIVPVRSGSEVTVVHEPLPREQAEHLEGRWSGMLYGLGTLLSSAGRGSRMGPARLKRRPTNND
jgi:uncharacterized protein YndB with AHSA1/START domain